jgi:hypothetical protein
MGLTRNVGSAIRIRTGAPPSFLGRGPGTRGRVLPFHRQDDHTSLNPLDRPFWKPRRSPRPGFPLLGLAPSKRNRVGQITWALRIAAKDRYLRRRRNGGERDDKDRFPPPTGRYSRGRACGNTARDRQRCGHPVPEPPGNASIGKSGPNFPMKIAIEEFSFWWLHRASEAVSKRSPSHTGPQPAALAAPRQSNRALDWQDATLLIGLTLLQS